MTDETQRKFPREIRIDIRDADGVLLRGAKLKWTEDGSDRGTIDARDGHGTIFPALDGSTIEVSASYDGKVLTEKLDVAQNGWAFIFDTVHQTPPVGAPVAPLRTPAPPMPADTWTARNGVILAALIGLVGTFGAAYWQSAKKAESNGIVTLTVYVKDRASGKPVGQAEVRLERASGPETRLADSEGAARFNVARGREDAARLEARAAGYEDTQRALRPLDADTGLDVLLDVKPKLPSAPPSPVADLQPKKAPSGTWQVQVAGDISGMRVKTGTLAFFPQPGGSMLVSGLIAIDGVGTRITGEAGQQNNSVFVEFEADANGRRWRGRATLELRPGNIMRGNLLDADGVALPLELKKS